MGRVYFKLFTFVITLAVLSIGYALMQENGIAISSLRRDVAPVNGPAPVHLITRDKENIYYQIGAGEELIHHVAGKGALRVITRFDFDNTTDAQGSYEVWIEINDKQKLHAAKQSKRSLVTKYKRHRKQTPGKIRNIWLDIPEGVHMLKFSLPKDATYRVNFRFLFEPSDTEAPPWKSIRPDYFYEKESLKIWHHTRNYYPIFGREPVIFEIKGPQELRLLTRWSSLAKTIEKGEYRVDIYQNQEFLFSQELSAGLDKGVHNASKQFTDSSFGRSQPVYIRVPHGKHRYDIYAEPGNLIHKIYLRPFIYEGNLSQLGQVSIIEQPKT